MCDQRRVVPKHLKDPEQVVVERIKRKRILQTAGLRARGLDHAAKGSERQGALARANSNRTSQDDHLGQDTPTDQFRQPFDLMSEMRARRSHARTSISSQPDP